MYSAFHEKLSSEFDWLHTGVCVPAKKIYFLALNHESMRARIRSTGLRLDQNFL